MKEIIDKNTISSVEKLGTAFSIGLLAVIISVAPLVMFLQWLGFFAWIILATVVFAIAIRLEKMKQSYDIQTYKEITAFMQGQRLDEIQKAAEKGKRVYQKGFLMLLFAIAGFLVPYFLSWLLG